MAIRRLKKASDADKRASIEALKTFMYSHDEITFALLYGSMIDPVIPGSYGDIDLALYIRPDYLTTSNYIFESKIEAEVYSYLSSGGLDLLPIEVLIINNAPYSFLLRLFKNEHVVLKEDEEALTDFIEEVGKRAMANSHFRSESLREVVGD